MVGEAGVDKAGVGEAGVDEAAAMDLSRLIAPKSIAFIGGREAAVAVAQCRRAGFSGPMMAVHPSRDDLDGVPCVRSIADLEEIPDAVFIAVPPAATLKAVAELAAIGAGGAVCYAAGFQEAGDAGAKLEAQLCTAAGVMPILGPNCYGLLNYLDGVALWPDVHGGGPVARGVAIVAQSSNLAINLTMQARSLPIAYMATLGNAALVSAADMIAAYARDDRVSVIGVHLEGLREGAGRFAAAVAQAQAAGKSVIVFKTGTSQAGARATLTHTRSMTGAAAAFSAFMDRLGVPQATTVPAFLEALKLLHVLGPLPGNRAVSMSCSGGEAALVADTAARHGVDLPPFDAAATHALGQALGPKVVIDNPLDYHTYIWLDAGACEACYTAALSADVDVGLLVLDYPAPGLGDIQGWDIATDALIAAARTTGRPTAVVASLPETLPEAVRARLMSHGIAPMQGIEETLFSIAAAAQAGAALAKPGDGALRPLAAALEVGPQAGQVVTVDEYRAKRRLAAAGITVPDGALVRDATEAVAAAEALGYPVALKAVSRDMTHKSDVGGVHLNLADGDAVMLAAEAMATLSDQLLVERMVDEPLVELIVGVTRDAAVGPCLMIGAGGILAEVMADSVLVTLPCGGDEIDAALGSLRVAGLLRGHRGRAAADWDAVVVAITAIARFAQDAGPALHDLEINPLIVGAHDVVAADAVVRWCEQEETV
jgi:acetyl-CoA synthetase